MKELRTVTNPHAIEIRRGQIRRLAEAISRQDISYEECSKIATHVARALVEIRALAPGQANAFHRIATAEVGSF